MSGIAGKPTRVTRWIHAGPCVVRVEVEAIIPDADPSEPCLGPDTVRWLDRLHAMAEAGQVDDLARELAGPPARGDIYVRRSA